MAVTGREVTYELSVHTGVWGVLIVGDHETVFERHLLPPKGRDTGGKGPWSRMAAEQIALPPHGPLLLVWTVPSNHRAQQLTFFGSGGS